MINPAEYPGEDALERFHIWWRLFHRDAFIPDGTGVSFNARLCENYVQYKYDVISRLRSRLIEKVIPAIAGGILLHRYHHFGGSQKAKIDIADLTSVTVNLIYRILFLFVAEYKGMLIADDPDNPIKGIYAIAKSALDEQESMQNIYGAVLKLFRSLYYGDPEHNVPPYRGELFDPSRPDFVFMAEQSIPDTNMREVFKCLMIEGDSIVDYECLDGYQLADIGDTLLNVSLEFTELPYTRRELVAKVGFHEGTGQPTGSDWIVPNPTIDYLVQQSIQNQMDERERKFMAEMETIVAIRQACGNLTAAQSYNPRHQQLNDANNRALEAMMGMRVLDPSMGTGRCLISVIQYLTSEIICRMQVYHDLHPNIPWDWNPLYVALDQERKRSHARLSRHGFEVKPEEYSDTLLLKRIITQKCVCGIDENPMAVAIAKHNIWLTTFSVGAPFSFLDHHLRHGKCSDGVVNQR